ncbi:MAG: hypothetical protein KDD19_14085 [Phaeodactylibacter sp.]|nr:hypothetical protein [Phaeodactylibacter sp.]MCB9051894.1 hypothetical protein [Lewinellaceae bacterium]
MKLLNTLLLYAFLPLFLAAQPTLEGGIFLGTSNYQGDFTLNASPEFRESNLAIGLVARHYFNFTSAVRANLVYGKLSGADANYAIRNDRGYSFTTSLVELSAVGEWEPFGMNRYRSGVKGTASLSPYFFGGLGLGYVNAKPDFGNDNQEKALQDLNAGNSKIQIILPVGLGLKANINKLWLAGLELGMRYPFTDYLDGVSEAGNPNKNDWYLFGGASLMYRIK